MEASNLTESDLANDSGQVTVEELAKFCADNRQQLPHPQRLRFDHLHAVTESDRLSAAERAEREAKEESERAASRQRSEIIQRAVELVSAAGQRYRDCTLGNFRCEHVQQSKVVKALSEYLAADATDNVILFGPVGTGKDHLAFALCKSAIRTGRTVRWVNGQAWFGIVRDAMETQKSEASLIAELARPDLLCLSDPLPPVGPLTPFQATMLYRMVDARYSKRLPTICTINVSTDAEADERMGAATWDRLTHGAWKLFCNWPTYRQPAREV